MFCALFLERPGNQIIPWQELLHYCKLLQNIWSDQDTLTTLALYVQACSGQGQLEEPLLHFVLFVLILQTRKVQTLLSIIFHMMYFMLQVSPIVFICTYIFTTT